MGCAPAIRIGDGMKIICDMKIHTPHHNCPHSSRGIVLEGSEDVTVNGIGAARVGDSGLCNCPHFATFTISEGSGTVFINGQAAVRTRDTATCQSCRNVGNLLNGSDTVFFG